MLWYLFKNRLKNQETSNIQFSNVSLTLHSSISREKFNTVINLCTFSKIVSSIFWYTVLVIEEIANFCSYNGGLRCFLMGSTIIGTDPQL